MCAALARTHTRIPSRCSIDAVDRSIRSTILFGIGAEDDSDGDRSSVFRVWAPFLSIATSKLAQRCLDEKSSMVRRDGSSRASESGAKVILRKAFRSCGEDH